MSTVDVGGRTALEVFAIVTMLFAVAGFFVFLMTAAVLPSGWLASAAALTLAATAFSWGLVKLGSIIAGHLDRSAAG